MPHDCQTYWGQSAEILIPVLQNRTDMYGVGWAMEVPDIATYHSLLQLFKELRNAVGFWAFAPWPWIGGPNDPDDIVTHAVNAVNGLQSDKFSTMHDPMAPGWLWTGDPNPIAITLAADLYGRVLEALDARTGAAEHGRPETPDTPVDADIPARPDNPMYQLPPLPTLPDENPDWSEKVRELHARLKEGGPLPRREARTLPKTLPGKEESGEAV